MENAIYNQAAERDNSIVSDDDAVHQAKLNLYKDLDSNRSNTLAQAIERSSPACPIETFNPDEYGIVPPLILEELAENSGKWTAMGYEAANVHLGTKYAAPAIQNNLASRLGVHSYPLEIEAGY